MAESEEKTEAPTPKKRKDSKKEGQVARTPELGGWLALLAFALAIGPITDAVNDNFTGLMKASYRAAENPEPAKAVAVLSEGLWFTGTLIVAIGFGALLIGVASALAQGGFFVATKAAKPSFKKLSPKSGIKRMFGLQALWEGLKTLLKAIVVAVICYSAGRDLMPLLGGVAEPGLVLKALGDALGSLLLTVSFAGLVMAAADYAFKRRKTNKEIRMTKTEVKQESKNSDGDPMVRSARRSRQMAMARNRMMSEVLNADVVMVNPTHVAVALSYDPESGAPRVVAKGSGLIATRIREKAAEGGVTMIEDIPLARALYGSCQVGQEIPGELFAAVAHILAFVMQRKKQGISAGTIRSPRDGTVLPEITSRRLVPIND